MSTEPKMGAVVAPVANPPTGGDFEVTTHAEADPQPHEDDQPEPVEALAPTTLAARVAHWVGEQIAAGHFNEAQVHGKPVRTLSLEKVAAARQQEIAAILGQHPGQGPFFVIVCGRAPLAGDPELDAALVAAGVLEEDLPEFYRLHWRCARGQTLIMRRPSGKDAISFIEKNSKRAAGVASIDAMDDGDDEVMASLMYPTPAQVEDFFSMFPGSSEGLRGMYLRLAYADVDAMKEVHEDRQREIIDQNVGPKRAAELGGYKNLVAFEAERIGIVVMRRVSRIELKKQQQASGGKRGPVRSVCDLGTTHCIVPNPDELATPYPGFAFVAGFQMMRLASGSLEAEEKK